MTGTGSAPVPLRVRVVRRVLWSAPPGREAGYSPVELMRSRYSAYALGDADYLWRTWHPRTRPDRVDPDPSTTWNRLEILEAGDDVVEFRAHQDRGVHHERSRFERRAGRWFYLDGEVG